MTLFHLIREDLEILYRLQTIEIEFPDLYNSTEWYFAARNIQMLL